MRWVRLLFRIFGWLLTPFLAWAASFFGAVAGALLALKMEDPVRGLALTAVCGGIAGFACLIAWLHYLRRSPEIREVLAVTEEGTPDTMDIAAAIDEATTLDEAPPEASHPDRPVVRDAR